MPLRFSGENYREWSEPRFYEAQTNAQVQQIELPVDKAFAMVADDTTPDDLTMWKFNKDSNAVASSTVIVPTNPAYTAAGRWIRKQAGGGGSGADFLSGHGSPEGVVTGDIQGQTYLDLDSNALWSFAGTIGTDTGWV